MTNNNYTTSSKSFQHLSFQKRSQIEVLLNLGVPKVKIAQTVGIARSTLYSEINRGSTTQLDSNLNSYTKYFADLGQKVYEQNRSNSKNPLKLVKAADFINYAQKQILVNKLSPDAICGYASKHNLFETMVCTKTLYNYIDQSLLQVKNINLPLKVKLSVKRQKNNKFNRILGKSIDERPEEINSRLEFGHWEIDTIVGTKEKSAVLLTLDERKTRMRIIKKIESKTAEAVNRNIKEIIEKYSEKGLKIFKTITADNGQEFAKLKEISKDIEIYYAHPYSPYERGTNEKQNSLVRRFIPKKMDINKVNEEEINKIQQWINNLPRKIFNYASSSDLFFSILRSF